MVKARRPSEGGGSTARGCEHTSSHTQPPRCLDCADGNGALCTRTTDVMVPSSISTKRPSAPNGKPMPAVSLYPTTRCTSAHHCACRLNARLRPVRKASRMASRAALGASWMRANVGCCVSLTTITTSPVSQPGASSACAVTHASLHHTQHAARPGMLEAGRNARRQRAAHNPCTL